MEVQIHERCCKNETDERQQMTLHQSLHDTIRLPKLGGEGGNYLQLMSWITDPMTSITEDKTTLFALVTSPIFHNLLWLHTSAKTNWASFKLNILRYVLVWKSLKCSMFHFSAGVWLQTIQTHLHLRPIMPPCIYCGNSPKHYIKRNYDNEDRNIFYCT